jgi:two-component system, NtrC family, response regulator HupR/HoxA
MEQWQDFDKLIVVKRLKDIIGRWFRVQMNFTDAKGYLRGVPSGKFFNPLNPVSLSITNDERGFKECVAEARHITVDSMGRKDAKVFRAKSGFSAVAVPIKAGSRYLGCVYADGFIVAETEADQKALIKNYVERLFPSDYRPIIQQLDEIPVLKEQEVGYLKELINIVVDEMVSMQKNISDQAHKVDELSKELGSRYGFDSMIGKSSNMQNLYKLVERIADSDTTVLVQGENGTGKELIAKALHYNSPRKKKKFITVNCGAFNENLLESELFGHVKGSFTGASKDKVGLFEAANGGTLFLDEVGDTSMTMQVKLLRVLQEGTYTPVGSTEVRKANVRVVAATNKNLEEMVQSGEFREDLYYRLNVINVVVPPLRDRREDITLLVDHFLDNYKKDSGKAKKEISKDCMTQLFDHDWPGNVRELENEIERLCVLAGNDTTITGDFLSPRIKARAAQSFPGLRMQGDLKQALEELEKQLIRDGLERTGWNKSRLAKELGISRAGLIMKVDKYRLEKRKA